MAKKDMLCLLGIIYFAISAILVSVRATNRCSYVREAPVYKTIWKYEGEDVRVRCPGYEVDSSPSFSVEYNWYDGAYNCRQMTTLIASFINHVSGNTRVVNKYPERMNIDKSGQLTIWNLTPADERTLTCIFMRANEYVAVVHLRRKDFQKPVLVGLSQPLAEDEVRTAECQIPKMRPTQGFIQVDYRGKMKKYMKLVDGSVPSVTVAVKGEANAGNNVMTCTAVQNVSGSVKELSSSVEVSVHYSYHTKVVSAIPDHLMELSNVTLNCEVTRDGNPPEISGYTWTRNENEIPGPTHQNGHDIIVPAGKNITLRNIRVDNSGSYQCQIFNEPDMLTPFSEAQELQLDVVPVYCLPGINFDRDSIEVEDTALTVSWTTEYPSGCKYDLPIEILAQVQGHSETMEHTTTLVTEKHVTITGQYDINADYEVCLIFKKYPEKMFCHETLEESVTEEIEPQAGKQVESKSYKVNQTGLIIGCSVSGCIGLALLIGLVMNASSRTKQREVQCEPPIYESHYDELDVSKLKDTVNLRSGLDNHQEEGESGSVHPLSQGDSLAPAMPPSPDVRDLDGSRPLDLCPEEEKHYMNRTMIMAAIPRKARLASVGHAVSLEELLDYCEDSYGTFPKKCETKKGSNIHGDYMNMREGGIIKREFKSCMNIPERMSKVIDHLDESDLKAKQIEDTLEALKESLDDKDDVAQKKPIEQEEQVMPEIYMDMSNVKVEHTKAI